MVPGARPLDEMEVALTRIAATYSDNLREHLERDENGLLRVAGLILPNDGSELVIVVDQFEEVFTLVEDESRRTHFLDLLHAAVTDPRSRVRVVITLRADFYDRPLNYAHFGELVRVHMETVLPLSAEELESAIVQPAAQVGVSFEPGLVATIISDSHYQPGALPLLQYALTELFEQRAGRKLTQAAYQALGGAVGALAKRADELFLEQSPEGREAVRQMFLRLVTLGEEAEDTRRRVSRGELLAVAANDGDLMDEVIDTYAAYRLLTLDHDPATRSPTVEMAHEAILHEWERLRGWLDTSRLDIRQQRLLAAAASDWHKANQDSSYLLRGARLDQFAAWAADAPIALTTRERSFLDASLDQQSHEAESERERQQKELALARRAAESQRRAANRLRIMVAGLVVFLLGAMSLALFALGQRNDAEAARNNERTARAQAEDSLRRTTAQRLGLESLSLVQTDGESNLIGLLAVQSITTNYTPQGDAAIQAAMLQQYPRHVFTSSYGAGAPFSLVLSPDEMFVAAILDGVALEVWNVETGESVLSSEEFDAIFLPDGHLATLRLDGTVHVWDLQTREATLVITLNDILGPRDNHLNILPDTNTLVIAGTTGWVVLVNAKTGDEIARFMTYPDAHWRDMTVSPDGTKLLLIGTNSYARLWDIETQQEIRNYYNNGEIGWKVAFAPDGQTIATATGAGLIRIWELDSPDAPLLTFNPHSTYVQGMAFSPDGTVLASSGADTRVHFWDVITGAEVRPPLVHSTATRWVLFSPDGQRVFSCSEDGLVWVWEVNPHFAFPEFNSPIAHQHADAFSPDGTLLAKINMKRLSFYDVATWTEVAYYETTQDNFLNGVTFSPDGRYVAFGTSSKTVHLWDVQAETIVQTYSGLDDFSLDVAVSSDNRYIAAGDFSGRLVVWNVESGVAVFSTTLDKQVYSVNFSPDGRFLLSTGWVEGKARLWNTTTWQEVWNLPMVSHEADAAFSPDGRFFVLGGGGIMLSLWEVDTLTKVRDFAGHYKDIMSVDFSRNGKYILSGGQDGTARLWDVETGVELRQFGVSTEVAAHVLFAPDGKYVLVTDNSLSCLWFTSIQDSIDYLCAHITRDLTEQERDLYEIKTDAPTCMRVGAP
ncbi:MAG: WD40 repeat domain-containing protein [Chloroflexi bacterium]|nr:WD40 repeat domain-containing protein [Chloroflexota bacterium]